MAKKYVSIEKLGLYDGKIKKVISDGDAAALQSAKDYADSLSKNYDAVGTGVTEAGKVQAELDKEIARAKAAEEASQTAADKAQGEVDALEEVVATKAAQADLAALAGKVGEVPADQTVMGIITNIQKNAYNDEPLRNEINAELAKKADKTQVATDIAEAVKAEEDARKLAVQGVQDAVNTLSGTHATDKAALEGAIALKANQTALDEVSETLADVKADVDAFFKDADMTESAKDTLKELQTYIASDETAASEMLASIQQNGKDIDAVEGRLDVVEPKVGTLEGQMAAVQGAVATKAESQALADETKARTEADTALDDRLKLVEAKFVEGDGSVEDMIADAIEAEVLRVDGELAKKVDKVDGKGLSTNDLTNELKGQYDAAYAHSQVAHAPANAQENVIESVKVNGVAQTITGKAVDIAVPTDNAQLANGAGYLVAADVANKADKATTLAGYGIADAYTSAQVDTAISDAFGQFVECSEEDINAMFTA